MGDALFRKEGVNALIDPNKRVPVVNNLVTLLPTISISLEPGVAIVADSTWSAISARRQLQVTWDEGRFANDSTAAFARQATEMGVKAEVMTVVRNDGDTSTALAGAVKVVEATYSYPFVSQQSIRFG